jgi:Flp pilus assembly protein TadG
VIASDSRTARRSRRDLGQAMVEFALVAPIQLFLFLAVLEGSLLVFTMSAFRYAASQAAIQEADLGNATNADTQAIQVIKNSPGITSLATVSEIAVQCESSNATGSLTPCASYPTPNRYDLNGTPLATPLPWPPSVRNVHSGVSDFLGVTISYTYRWQSGWLLGSSPLTLRQTYHARLEPQSY